MILHYIEGVFILNITRINKNKAKIYFTDKELKALNIPYKTFNENNYEAKLFIGNIITMLNELNILKINSGSITVDIVKKIGNGIIVYIDNDPCKRLNETSSIYLFDNSFELVDFCRNESKIFQEYISSAELFLINNKYALLLTLITPKNIYKKIQSHKKFLGDDEILANKIKEYGEKISDTPIQKITELP